MGKRWTREQAWEWYDALPWLTGCNFIPSTAINQIEMWSADTFDEETIARELGWAADIGFNTMRVYLHDLCWAEDADGFEQRIDRYLAIASDKGIRTLLVLFDDCWHEPKPGPQPTPRPGIHNSGWVRSPGREILLDRSRWHALENYVTAIAKRFAHDPRVLAWDVYNEPTNLFLPSASLPDDEREAALAALQGEQDVLNQASIDLLTNAFSWLRAAGVSQPLTAGIFYKNDALNAHLLELSDMVSFHHYQSGASLERFIGKLKGQGRPLLCTEYLNRRDGCTFESHMSVFQRERIACWNWGLVDGKTQTKYAWSDKAGDPENPIWFHDIFESDGTPHAPPEIDLIQRLRAEADAAV